MVNGVYPVRHASVIKALDKASTNPLLQTVLYFSVRAAGQTVNRGTGGEENDPGGTGNGYSTLILPVANLKFQHICNIELIFGDSTK